MRLCDVCHGQDDGSIEDLGLGPYNKPEAGTQVARDVKPIATADVCGGCRTVIETQGLADGIALRVKDARPTVRRRRTRAAGQPAAADAKPAPPSK